MCLDQFEECLGPNKLPIGNTGNTLIGLCTAKTLIRMGSGVTRLIDKTLLGIQENMSLVMRKPVFRVSDQGRHKPGCTGTEDG